MRPVVPCEKGIIRSVELVAETTDSNPLPVDSVAMTDKRLELTTITVPSKELRAREPAVSRSWAPAGILIPASATWASRWFLPRPRQHVIGTNLVSHSNFVRLLVRVLVLVDVFLCQRVDVIVGIVCDLYNLSTQRDETIRILGILDAECDLAVAAHIFIFNSAFCAINPHVSAIVVAPYRRDLWAAIIHNRR